MIAPDDARHGTTAGHITGCRCKPCCAAKLAYDKRRRMDIANGQTRRVPAWRMMRRIHALQTLGWSLRTIADEAGFPSHDYCRPRYDYVYTATFEALAAAYERLSMQFPPTETGQQRAKVARVRNYARKQGWAPPLAWDEGALDDPDARPYNVEAEPTKPAKPGKKRRTDVDESVVLAVLSGERRDTTPGEKQEIGRRWRAMGKPMAELARVTGWTKVERYGRAA